MRLTELAVPLVLLVAGAAPAAAQSFTVNVKDTWCGGDCREGHDEKQCICSFDDTGWTDCGSVDCCQPDGSANYYTVSGANVCARTNETGFWSWASWKAFFGADTCNLDEQSPWDDSGSGLSCSDGSGGDGGDVQIGGGFVEGEYYETEGGCWFRQGEWVPSSWCESSCSCWIDGWTCYCYALMAD